MSDAVEPVALAAQAALGTDLVAAYRFGADFGRGRRSSGGRLLLLIARLEPELLERLVPVAALARQTNVLLRVNTPDDLLRGADAFPASSLELVHHRQLLAGADVLASLTVHTKDLRLHIEHGLRSLLRDLIAAHLELRPLGDDGRELRRAARRLVYLLEGTLLAAAIPVPQPPTAPAVLDAVRAAFLSGVRPESWNVLAQFVRGELTLDGPTAGAAYASLFEVIPALVDVVDRMPATG